MNTKKMVKKGMKSIEIKEELHRKLMQIKYGDKNFTSVSQVIEWLITQAKV